jgi:predicted transcriptional regulator
MQKVKETTRKVNVTCRMDKEDVAFLDKLGEWMERDRSYMVKYAVGRLRDEHDWQVEQVELARREVKEGKFLTEEEFIADMKTWL